MKTQESIDFDYGTFYYKRKRYQFSHNKPLIEIPIIIGKFHLNNNPSFYRDFERYFQFYDLKSIESLPWTNEPSASYQKLICLG
ncbi:MAG: hypothetical protein ACTSX0_12960, partial [Promethearchaeota archaeon]